MEKFEQWCLVELFGHTKIAGKCTEQNIAGTNMLRVDVPATSTQPSFTRFFGSTAIYSLNPIDEKTAQFYANKLNIAPIIVWEISEFIKANRPAFQLSENQPVENNRGKYIYPLEEDEVDDPNDVDEFFDVDEIESPDDDEKFPVF